MERYIADSCCFCGHSQYWYPYNIKEMLIAEIENLVENYGVKNFYVGSYGEFDAKAYSACLQVKETHPNIRVLHVFAYYGNASQLVQNDAHVVLDLGDVHYKARITETNRAMVDMCQYLICFVSQDWASRGAIKTYKYAKKLNRNIINLFEK